MCGFTEDEVKELIKKANLKNHVYDELKKNYDGYRFSYENEAHMFNTTLVMYYLRNYVNYGKAPRDLVDSNLATTGNKIESFVNLINPKKNYEKLMELITTNQVDGNIVRQFELNDNIFNEDSFLSLLYYQGYITIKDISIITTFCIPNYISEILYASYFQKIIATNKEYNLNTEDITNGLVQFGENGSIKEMTKVIVSFLSHQSVRDKENLVKKL